MLEYIGFAAALFATEVSAQVPQSQPPLKQASAVSVDAYRRDYEGAKSDSEVQYDTDLWVAYSAKAGQMEGSWEVTGPEGASLFRLELREGGQTQKRIDGAWRSLLAGFGMNNSGLVSEITLTDQDMTVVFTEDRALAPTILKLRKLSRSEWTGTLRDGGGQQSQVRMKRLPDS